MQLALAALVPAATFLLLLWRNEHRRVAMLFAGIVLLYVSPYLILQGTPASLDFVLDEAPWSHLTPHYLQKNYLLNDVPLGILPWQEVARSRWASGTLPLLNRTQGSGSVFWLNPHALALHPTTLYSLLFSTFGWPMAVLVTKLLVALWGTFLFLGRHGLSTRSRVFGSIAYAFCIFNIGFALFPHTNITTLLPLLLYELHHAAESWRGAAHATVVAALILLGGHPESILHIALIAGVYAIPLILEDRQSCLSQPSGQTRLSVLQRFVAIALIAGAIAAPILLPFAGYLRYSERAHDAERQLIAPEMSGPNLIPFIVPNYFGNPRVHNYRWIYNFNEIASQYAGLATMVLAITAAIAQPRRFRWWIASFITFVLLALQPSFVRALLLELPYSHLTNQGRLRFGAAFVTAVLGAHGLEMLMQRRRLAASVAIVVGAGTMLFILMSYPVFAEYGIRRLIVFTEIAAILSLIFVVAARPVAIVALVFLDLVSVAPLYNPQNRRDMNYPSTPAIRSMKDAGVYRITGIKRALQPMTSTMFGLEDIRTHDPLTYEAYIQILEAAGLDRTTYFEQFPTVPPQSLIDFLGVRYLIAPPRFTASMPVHYAGADAVVFRNDTAMPRYFVPSAMVRTTDPARTFLDEPDRTRVHSAVREGAMPPASVALVAYEPNASTIVVRATQPTFLASSEVALPGWRLTRNGAPWPGEPINGAFLGWTVPAGESRFVLRYEPPYLRAGAACGVAGLVALAAMFIASRRRNVRSAADSGS